MVVDDGSRVLGLHYKNMKMQKRNVQLDEYNVLDLYRDCRALYEKCDVELPEYIDLWYSMPNSRTRCKLDRDDAWLDVIRIWGKEIGEIPIHITKDKTPLVYYYITQQLNPPG